MSAERAADLQVIGTCKELAQLVVSISDAARHGMAAAKSDSSGSARPAWSVEFLEFADAELARLDGKLAELRASVNGSPSQRSYWGSTVQQLEVARDRVDIEYRAYKARPASVDLLQVIDVELKSMSPVAAEIWVPEAFDEYLRGMPIGGCIETRTIFEPLLPEASDQLAVVRWLSAQSGEFSGIFDIAQGTVTRVGDGVRRRVLDSAFVLACVGLAIAAGAVAQRVVTFPSKVGSGAVIWAEVLAFGGALGHVAINALKNAKSADASVRNSVMSLQGWGRWLSAHKASLGLSVLGLGAVVIYLRGWTGNSDALLFVAVGYSVDSVLEVFSNRASAGLATFASTVIKL